MICDDHTWAGEGDCPKCESAYPPEWASSGAPAPAMLTYLGRPVESLTREELIAALYVAMGMAKRAQQERAAMRPFVNYGEMLRAGR